MQQSKLIVGITETAAATAERPLVNTGKLVLGPRTEPWNGPLNRVTVTGI